MQRVSKLWVLFVTIILCGCVADGPLIQKQTKDAQLIEEKAYIENSSERLALQSWWNFFNDDVLNDFISSALNLNQVIPAQEVLGQEQGESPLKELQDRKADFINEIAQHYLKFRYIQNQYVLLKQYTIERKAFYERNSKTIKSASQKPSAASEEIERLEKQQKNYVLQQKNIADTLARYTKLLPEYVEERLKNVQDIPRPDITPILASDALILQNAKEITVAQSFYKYTQPIILSGYAIGPLFGISDEAFMNNTQVWHVQPGHAAQKIQVPDDKKHQELRKDVLEYIMDIEHRITTYAHLRTQQIVLQSSAEGAKKNYEDMLQGKDKTNAVLTAQQDEANKTALSALKARYEMSKVLIDLYHKLGVY